MKTVEASAVTREEAIQKALDELGVEMYEVDKIEILDEGSKGLLGFGVRPVRVKLIVEHLSDEPEPAPQAKRPRPGGQPRGKTRDPRQKRETRNGAGKSGRGRADKQHSKRPDRKNDKERRGPAQAPKKPALSKDAGNSEPQEPISKPAPEPTKQVQARKPPDEVVSPITDVQGKEAAALLQEIITKMGIKAEAVFGRAADSAARINVTSEDGALLIGRKGRNLSAMQYLINRIIARGDVAETTERVVVDVEGYVDRRKQSLEGIALSLAEKAKKTGRNMRLNPMSPQERRIVHLVLENDEDVRTFSLGESLFRSVVISPKNAKPEHARPAQGRGGRGRGNRAAVTNAKRDDDDMDAGQFGD